MAPFVKPAASATSSRLPSSTPRSANTRSPASRRSTRVSLFRLARMIPMEIKDTGQNPNRPTERPPDQGEGGTLRPRLVCGLHVVEYSEEDEHFRCGGEEPPVRRALGWGGGRAIFVGWARQRSEEAPPGPARRTSNRE